MNNATAHHTGKPSRSQRQKAETASPTAIGLRRMDATDKGRGRTVKGHAQVGSEGNASDAFLKCTFLPRLKEAESDSVPAGQAETERDFYLSLSLLAEHFGIKPIESRSYGYPYNIAVAIADIENRLKASLPNWDSLRFVRDGCKTYLETEERYSVDTKLYYIPLAPLLMMLADAKRKRNARLLVSVCSYLYHIADIPYYTHSGSYLSWMYEMMGDWITEDDCNEQRERDIQELLKADWIGVRMEQKIFNRNNLVFFEKRLDAFITQDDFDNDCRKVASNALALFREYPEAHIFRNAPEQEERGQDCDGCDSIPMAWYISFIAETRGWLYETINDSINNEFNEYGGMDSPVIRTKFDGSEITRQSLDFETRLFRLLEDLCTLLNDYKTTRR
ncbi:hypothetical protein [Sphingobacterium siyangense]|uniref:hypothetical protein n=1 Tax=Sphingobacterium siyangense TaxID=459529 RepID=UPI001965BC35|nr:hypothetical protein [Sphingobacterium siyangense]QRY55525.1 hypothetical protein JVX97_15910 [Sphingobacterium siyangense]